MRSPRDPRRSVPVITEAAESPARQLRRRQVRYATLMGLRVVCLVAAAVLVSAEVPHALGWVVLLSVGMVALPWMAVLIANDRPPRKAGRLPARFFRARAAALPPVGDGAADGPAGAPDGAPGRSGGAAGAGRVIDG